MQTDGPVSGVTSSVVRHIPWLYDPSDISLRDTNTNFISSNQTAVHAHLIVTWKPARDKNPESPDIDISIAAYRPVIRFSTGGLADLLAPPSARI
jgi:hypothetical protein